MATIALPCLAVGSFLPCFAFLLFSSMPTHAVFHQVACDES